MDEFLLEARTKASLKALLQAPMHGYLFWGPIGLGKTSLANYCASELIGSDSVGDKARWIKKISRLDDKKKISIAQVKPIIEFLYQKLPKEIAKKVVIIDDAESLSKEAGNALLKALEEPPVDSVLILVTANNQAVPQTVCSRLAPIQFRPPKPEQVSSYFGNNKDIDMLLTICGLRPAMIAGLLANKEKLIATIQLHHEAKDFITGALVKKLTVVQKITKDQSATEFIDQLAIVAGNDTAVAQALLFADTHLYNSGNPRFVLEHLALELS